MIVHPSAHYQISIVDIYDADEFDWLIELQYQLGLIGFHVEQHNGVLFCHVYHFLAIRRELQAQDPFSRVFRLGYCLSSIQGDNLPRMALFHH